MIVAKRAAGIGQPAGILPYSQGMPAGADVIRPPVQSDRGPPYCSYFDAFSPKHTGICAAKRVLAKTVFCSNSLFRRVFASFGDSVETHGATGMAQQGAPVARLCGRGVKPGKYVGVRGFYGR
ncbi:hypothetical protein J8I29_04055 [Labrys sp. LIt4]|uniref:hypothetical protein n=1 Tax=Labrys sp. LIt4 TaxID=2821355 RepID=UPI001ADF72A7|nr:hypothetical protein [Labrys sp. LIt4]MBP0578474.1 hypothetical protein [Labrys sp. LIt4]